MIAEVATVCVTAVLLYGMRQNEARVLRATAEKNAENAASAERLDALEKRVSEAESKIATTDGRVSAALIRR